MMALKDFFSNFFNKNTTEVTYNNKENPIEDNQILKELITKLKKYKTSTVRIAPKKVSTINIFDSKIGGNPYWPKNMEYPTNSLGENLYLLAQLNLNTMPSLEGYPDTGILQFFILDDDLYGCDFNSPDNYQSFEYNNYKIVYHENISENNKTLLNDFPTTKNHLPISGEYILEFDLVEEYPAPSDYLFENIIDNIWDYGDQIGDYIYDNFVSDGSKIGGYAYFTQEDPRHNTEEWVLLLQIDSSDSDNIDIMWGDCGVANFFIKKEKLLQGDFSQVWYNWDCH